MKNNELVIVAIYLIAMYVAGFGFGWAIYKEKYEELKGINNNLYYVIQDKDKAYYELEQQMTEYRWKLDSCYQQIGDMQDDYDVNNDGVVDAVDYVAIKKYIMSREKECFVNGGWNCE